jgi:Skp family chaperone for outer membrane proteins
VRTLVTVMALATLATTSAMAQAPKVKAARTNLAHIYQSYSQGNQTFPNPDRDFQGEYAHSADY